LRPSGRGINTRIMEKKEAGPHGAKRGLPLERTGGPTPGVAHKTGKLTELGKKGKEKQLIKGGNGLERKRGPLNTTRIGIQGE